MFAADTRASPPATTVGEIVARVERLPVSWWHVKTRIVVGVATFFDAFDALAIASHNAATWHEATLKTALSPYAGSRRNTAAWPEWSGRLRRLPS